MQKILFIMIGLSISIWAGFTRDDSTNIVTDRSTGLQWQDDINVIKPWMQAIDYCEVLTLGSHSDWRLPNFNELYFIADRTKRNPAIDTTFQNVASADYWSSSTVVSDENSAWSVGFVNGDGQAYQDKTGSHYVRCVRAGQ